MKFARTLDTGRESLLVTLPAPDGDLPRDGGEVDWLVVSYLALRALTPPLLDRPDMTVGLKSHQHGSKVAPMARTEIQYNRVLGHADEWCEL